MIALFIISRVVNKLLHLFLLYLVMFIIVDAPLGEKK